MKKMGIVETVSGDIYPELIRGLLNRTIPGNLSKKALGICLFMLL
jgi:hypothetical protein